MPILSMYRKVTLLLARQDDIMMASRRGRSFEERAMASREQAPCSPFTANSNSSDDRCDKHLELECDYPSRSGGPESYRCGELVTHRGPVTTEAERVVAEAKTVHLVTSPGSSCTQWEGAQGDGLEAGSAYQRVAAIDGGWIVCSASGLTRSSGVASEAAGVATLVASFCSGAGSYIAAAVGGDVIVEEAATGKLVEGGPQRSEAIDDAAELRWHASEPLCVVRRRTGALVLIDVERGGASWSGTPIACDAWRNDLSVCSVAWSPTPGKKLLACGLGAGAATAWGGTFKIESDEIRCGSIVVIDLERGNTVVARFGCPLFYSGISTRYPAVVAASCETLHWVERGINGSTIFAGYVMHCPVTPEDCDGEGGGDFGEGWGKPPRDGIEFRPVRRVEPDGSDARQVNRTAAPTLCALEPDDIDTQKIARATIFYGLAQPFESAAQREAYYTALRALKSAGDLRAKLETLEEEDEEEFEELESKIYGPSAEEEEKKEQERPAEEGAPFATAFSAKRGVLTVASTAQPGDGCDARIALVRYVEAPEARDSAPRWTTEQLWRSHPDADEASVTVADLCGGASDEMRARLKRSALFGLAVLDGDSVLLCAVNRESQFSAVSAISLVEGNETPRSLPVVPVASDAAPGGSFGAPLSRQRGGSFVRGSEAALPTAALPRTPRALTWAKEYLTPDAAELFNVPYERARTECIRCVENSDCYRYILQFVRILRTI